MQMRLVLFLSAILAVFDVSAQTQVGALKHGEVLEISVVYTNQPAIASALDLGNYGLAPGELISSRVIATNYGVVLAAQNVPADNPEFLSISGVTDPEGNPFPSELISFNSGHFFWTAIGGQELGFSPDAFCLATNDFDVYSGGIQQRDDYDEATFVGESIGGDFDRIVRVEYVEPAGFGAKAGLMVRESLDEGKPRPLDPENLDQGFSRYIEVAVNAPVDALGAVTGTGHLVLRRANNADGVTEITDDGVTPQFPDVWLRIKRSGQSFSIYRGTNGVDWTSISGISFATTFPDTAYVGVAFSPQNDDLPPGTSDRKSFVAKFRSYKSKEVIEAKLTIGMSGDHAVLSWTGSSTLETATDIVGPWTKASSQSNPQDVTLSDSQRFYRLH